MANYRSNELQIIPVAKTKPLLFPPLPPPKGYPPTASLCLPCIPRLESRDYDIKALMKTLEKRQQFSKNARVQENASSNDVTNPSSYSLLLL